jgi:DNA-binding CsgD family transcriptional regulator
MTAPVMVGPSPQGGGPAVSLTEAHVRVLHLAAHGNTDQEIGEQMFISRNTVLGYWKLLKPRLGAEDRTHAVAIAVSLGLVTLSFSARPRSASVKATATAGRVGELLDLAEAGCLTADAAAELRALVASLDQTRRSAGGLQRGLAEARAERDRAERASAAVEGRLRQLVGQLPENAVPLRRVLSRAADDLKPPDERDVAVRNRTTKPNRTS